MESVLLTVESSTEQITDVNTKVSVYYDVIKDYKYIVSLRFSEKFESTWNDDGTIELSNTLTEALESADKYYQWSCMIIEMPFGITDATKEDFGYVLFDINNDEVPELFWVANDHTVLAVFTYYDNHVKLLDAFWPRYDCVITDDGSLYTNGSGGAWDNSFEIKSLTSDAEFATKVSFGMYTTTTDADVKYYEWIYDEKVSISEERFNELLVEYPFEQSDMWMNTEIIDLFK